MPVFHFTQTGPATRSIVSWIDLPGRKLSTLRYEKFYVFLLDENNLELHDDVCENLKLPVQCGDVELEKKIEEKIDQFISWVEKHPNKKSQICLSFYETKNKHPSWFNKTERLFWEHWYVNLHVTQHTKAHSGKSHHSKPMVVLGETVSEERGVRKEALEASLHENEQSDNYMEGNILASHFLDEMRKLNVEAFIGFSFWDGCVQEDATDRTSNHAQLIIIVGHLNCFVDYFECQQFNYSDFLVRDPKASLNFTVHFEQFVVTGKRAASAGQGEKEEGFNTKLRHNL
ncbi:hypothetical protein NC652_018768 [Populus alba x Populus x berolinensis]|nr:hypothetical protein NC652_018768 [Populus alba x Populus x berolinensis]